MQRQPLAARHRHRIAAGLPFVESLARRVASSMPHSIELGDLVQDGMIGLIDAACRFDEDRGIKFETFAERRVRGAMIDALRRDAWPRGVRRQRRELEAAREELRRELGAEPSLADSPRASARTKRASAAPSSASTRSNRRRRSRPARTSTARRCRPRSCRPSRSRPTAAYEEHEVRDRVRAAIASLPPRERKVIGLYYYGEATMKQIGAEIGVNESRVSQLHARAVQRLRKALGADCPTEARSARRSCRSRARCGGCVWPKRKCRTNPAWCCSTAHRSPRCAKDGRPPEDRGGTSGTDRGGDDSATMSRCVVRGCVIRETYSNSDPGSRIPHLRISARGSVQHLLRHAQQILQPERLGEPAAAGLLEEPLGVGAGDIAGDEEDAARHRGIDGRQLAVERRTVQPAASSDRRRSDRRGRSVSALERLYAIAGAIDEKTGIGQRLGDSGAERRFIFDDQRRGSDADVAGRRALFRRSRDRRLERPDADRQLDVERGAAPRLGLDGDAPAMLLDDRVRDGQTEARALPDLFRREKRIENLRLHVLGHTRAVVVDLEDHRVAIGVVPGADDQRAAAVRAEHGLLRVDDQVQQHLLDLVRIGKHFAGVPTASASRMLMLLMRCSYERSAKRFAHDLVEVHHRARRVTLAGERQEIAHDLGRALRLAQDRFETALGLLDRPIVARAARPTSGWSRADC